MVNRWWCNTGEPLWSSEAWRLLFLWDDGHLWGLDLERAEAQAGRENLHWDYEGQRLIETPPRDLAPEEAAHCLSALKAASPLTRTRMSNIQTSVLDRVASTVEEQRPWVTAKRLRKEFEDYGTDGVTRAAMALCPRYLDRRENSDGDYFQVTFAGLLESKITGRVSAVVEATLRELRRAYSADPDMNLLHWSPIRQTLGWDDDKGFLFARNVHGAMGWPRRDQKEGQEWLFDVPDDVEQIHYCSNLPEYLRYLRTQSLRPWPTSPEAPRPLSTTNEISNEERQEVLFAPTEIISVAQAAHPENASSSSAPEDEMFKNPRDVFVVYGRNNIARTALFDLLRCVGLNPMEWEQARRLTGKASPYIGQVLDSALANAQAIVVLLTGDDEARLRNDLRGPSEPPYEMELTPQARQNVLFEAGMALGRDPDRTLLIEVGDLRPLSDLTGRHTIRLRDGGVRERQAIIQRLRDAGCAVVTEGSDWLERSFFDVLLAEQQKRAETGDLQGGPRKVSGKMGEPVANTEPTLSSLGPVPDDMPPDVKPKRKAITRLDQIATITSVVSAGRPRRRRKSRK